LTFETTLFWSSKHRPTLAYRQMLPNDRKPSESTLLLFTHGLGDSGACFARLTQLLPTRWTKVALDWRGHGRSDWQVPGVSSYSQADHVLDLSFFAEHLQATFSPRWLIIVGHSLGGCTALLAAGLGQLPSVAAVVMLDACSAGGLDEQSYAELQAQRLTYQMDAWSAIERPRLRRFQSEAEALEWTAVKHLGFLSPGGRAPDDVAQAILDGFSEAASDGSVAILGDPRIHAGKDSFVRIPASFERTVVLPNVVCPVLFLIAGDGPCRLGGISDPRGRIAHMKAPTELHVLPSGGHYAHIDGRTIDRVAHHIKSFVEKVESSNGKPLGTPASKL